MNDVYVKRAPTPTPAINVVNTVKLRADDTHTLLAEADHQGVIFYDRRGGGKQHLLTWNELEQLHRLFAAHANTVQIMTDGLHQMQGKGGTA